MEGKDQFVYNDQELSKITGEEKIEDEDEIAIDEILAEILGEEEEVKEGLLDKITSFFGSVLGDFERENKDLISKFQSSAKTAEDKKELIDALTAWGRKNQIEGPYIQAARTAASEKYGLGLKGGSPTAQMGTFEEAKEMEETVELVQKECLQGEDGIFYVTLDPSDTKDLEGRFICQFKLILNMT